MKYLYLRSIKIPWQHWQFGRHKSSPTTNRDVVTSSYTIMEIYLTGLAKFWIVKSFHEKFDLLLSFHQLLFHHLWQDEVFASMERKHVSWSPLLQAPSPNSCRHTKRLTGKTSVVNVGHNLTERRQTAKSSFVRCHKRHSTSYTSLNKAVKEEQWKPTKCWLHSRWGDAPRYG